MLSLATLAPSAYTLSTPVVASTMRASVRMEVPPPPPSAFTADMNAPVTVPDVAPPLPKIKTMQVGDKTLAGDFGFDPAGFAKDPASLAWYREAEVKHARLAMLAAIGWPVSEIFNFGDLLTADGRAPALLNGGLGEISGLYWAGAAAFAAYWEGRTFDKMFGKQEDYLPGMLKFDPLGLDAEWSRSAEMMNGRLAMLAITAYAVEEAVTKAAIFPVSLIAGTPEVTSAAAVKPSMIAGATSILDPNSLPAELALPVEAPPPVLEAATAAVEAATDAVAAVSEVATAAAEVATTAAAEVAPALSPIGDALF